MNIVEKNYEALKKYYPEIYERIINFKEPSKYKIIDPVKIGEPSNLLNTVTGRFFYPETNVMPTLEAEMKRRDIKLTHVNIFLGAGLTYQIFAFFNAHKITGGSHFVIEKRLDIFKAAMQCIDLSAMFAHPNMIFIVGGETKEIFTTVNKVLQTTDAKFYIKAMNFIEHPVCYIEDKDYYINAIRAIKDAVREVMLFFGNDPNDSMIGIDNTFKNIEEIIENPGIVDLKDKFKGKPGIVVSTGPSLNKNINLLKGLENKAVICGPDASLRVMRKHGLKPHMITSLERLIPTSLLFANMETDDFKDVYFAGAPVVHPQTYANFKGDRIVVFRNFATFKWLDINKGILDIGPSAGNMAFKVLEYMGCDPIILIGQDLAFGEDGNTHAKGSTNGEKEVNPVYDDVRYVEGNYTPKLKTTKVWDMFLNYYHKDVAESKATVINATEGGAKIFGTKLMTFQEAIDKYIHDDIDTLDTIRKSLIIPDDATKEQQRQMTLEKVARGLEVCDKAIQIFDKSYNLCDKYFAEIWEPFKKGEPYKFDDAVKISIEIEECAKIFGDPEFFNVLMHYVQSYFIRSMIEVNGIKANDDKPEDQHFKIIETLKDMSAVMIHLISRMILLLGQLKIDLEKDMQERDKNI